MSSAAAERKPGGSARPLCGDASTNGAGVPRGPETKWPGVNAETEVSALNGGDYPSVAWE